MRTYSQVKKELLAHGANKYMVNSLEAKALPKILHDSEKILAFIYGAYDHRFGMMVATDRRLIFLDSSWIGQRVDDIPYHMVASVEYDLGPLWGHVQVHARSKTYHFRLIKKNLVGHFAKVIERSIIDLDEALSKRARR